MHGMHTMGMAATTHYTTEQQPTRTPTGHSVTITVGGDYFALTVMAGPTPLDEWGHNFGYNFDTAASEAGRIRRLIEHYGSIAAIEQRTTQLIQERAEQDSRSRNRGFRASAMAAIRRIDAELDELDTPATRAACQDLGERLSDLFEPQPAADDEPEPAQANPNAPMTRFQAETIAYALLAGTATLGRGRGQGLVSIRTLRALAARGFVTLLGDHDNPTGGQITATGATRATQIFQTR